MSPLMNQEPWGGGPEHTIIIIDEWLKTSSEFTYLVGCCPAAQPFWLLITVKTAHLIIMWTTAKTVQRHCWNDFLGVLMITNPPKDGCKFAMKVVINTVLNTLCNTLFSFFLFHRNKSINQFPCLRNLRSPQATISWRQTCRNSDLINGQWLWRMEVDCESN